MSFCSRCAAAHVSSEDFPGPAYYACEIIYRNHPRQGRFSRRPKSFRRLNDALQKVLTATIEAGLPFKEGDIATVYRNLGGAYWFGSPAADGFYCVAVEVGNISACRSIEAWWGQKPFMWNGKRLAYASTLVWRDGVHSELVRVTSLHDTHLVACAYDAPWPRGKVVRRYTITHKQLRAAQRTDQQKKRRAKSNDRRQA